MNGIKIQKKVVSLRAKEKIMCLKVKRHFTNTSEFGNGILPFCKPFAHSLEWLYDEDNFQDERYWLYCMDDVLPLYDMLSIVTDIIVIAFGEYGETNIRDYINRMENGNLQHGLNDNKPYLKYDGDYIILGKVSSFTTEVILWAAFLYCHFRHELEENNEKAKRAVKVLYKLFRQKTGVKKEFVKDTFLMKHFVQTMQIFYKNISTNSSEFKEENVHNETRSTNMEESMLTKIPANNIRYYYEGWRNGKHGSICQTNGIYRFVEQKRGKSGLLDDVNRNEEDNPIVAIGIVAYWLQFNSKMDPVIKRMTKYNCEIPKDIREQFDKYTQIRFEQFKQKYRDDPNTLEWDWDREFYANVIIPHEIAFNKRSEVIFDYISDSDIVLVRSVMNSYIKYLKKIRTEKGYQVNPELLVLRAIESGDKTKQEDLEEFEVNTILDKLEEKGYIKVAWIEGHKPEAVRLLDKGRCYLKQLEEGRVVDETKPIVETKPVVTPQQPPKEHKAEIPPQTSKMPQSPKKSIHIDLIEEEEWDDTFDYIFNEKVKPQEIMRSLVGIVRPKKISEVRFFYVSCRILEILNYLTEDALRTDFMRWINIHFKCGWPDDKEHKRRFSFALEGSSKILEDQHPSLWDKNTIKGGSGIYHHQLAIKLKNTFTQTIINGEAIDDSNSFDHLIDRGQYLRFAIHLQDNEYYIPEEAYINNGK